jgi:Tfp pilus assembly protein PilN
MRRIDLDFSARPPVAIRIGRRVAAVVLAAGLVAGGLWAQRYLELHHELAEWRDTLQRVDRRRAGETQRQPVESAARLKAELQRANRVIEALSTPWPDLFTAAESAYSERAILMGIEPDTERREVRLTAEAKDLPAMLEYLKSLRQSPVLMDATLASHQINAKDSQRPVRFVVMAHWFDVPPAPTATAPQEKPADAPAESAR